MMGSNETEIDWRLIPAWVRYLLASVIVSLGLAGIAITAQMLALFLKN